MPVTKFVMDSLADQPAPRPLRIAILAEQRYLNQAQPEGMRAALRAQGHDVTLVVAGAFEAAGSLGLDRFDLIVVRGRSWSLLARLAAAESCARPILNPRSAIAAVHNKADMAVTLAEGGVPTPRTFIGRLADLANVVPATCYPLILKPIFGDNASGLRLVNTSHALRSLQWPEETALAQHYLPNDGFDIKLYGIGEDVWAVRKRSPLAGPGRTQTKVELLPPTPEFEALGRRCARLFGLHLYGVDCLQTPGGPLVIEVNEFPNYTGVPDADRALAHYAIHYARHCARSRHEHWHIHA